MQAERERILKMVKEGKLTVNEALVLLDELGKPSEQKDPFGELPTFMKFEEAKKEDPFSQQKFQATKDKLFEFVDVALKKIKDFDLDINFGQSVSISHIFQQSDVNLKELDIDLSNGSVRILPWSKKDVRIECEAKVYRVDSSDEARDQLLRDVYFAVDGHKLKFSSEQKWMKIHATLFVPEEQYETIKVRMFNGPIESENLKVDKYNVKTANGKIVIIGLEGQYVDAETANGQVEVKNTKVDDFEVETINGAIKVDGSFKKIDLQSFNGNIDCSISDDRLEFMEAKATTGAINLYIPEGVAMSGEAKTNMGNFNIDYIGCTVIEEKNEVLQKLVRFQPTAPSDKIARVLADTKTGSISIKRVL